jgi:hypothetical protein
MRDRLMKLIQRADAMCGSRKQCEGCVGFGKGADCCDYNIAAHLIANGVIVPPCKVGDTVYQTDGERIYESCITHIEIYSFVTVFYTDGVAFDETAIGHSIYLTKEEAEKALAERSGE